MPIIKVEQFLGETSFDLHGPYYTNSTHQDTLSERVDGKNVILSALERTPGPDGICIKQEDGSIKLVESALLLNRTFFYPRRIVAVVDDEWAEFISKTKRETGYPLVPKKERDYIHHTFGNFFRFGEKQLGLLPRKISPTEKLIGLLIEYTCEIYRTRNNPDNSSLRTL